VISFRPRPLYPQGRAPGTHFIGGCVGPRIGLHTQLMTSAFSSQSFNFLAKDCNDFGQFLVSCGGYPPNNTAQVVSSGTQLHAPPAVQTPYAAIFFENGLTDIR
jgi:hypothetical protein